MYSLNKVMILGNLTRDPEPRSTPDGTQISQFSVATNFNWTDQSGVKQERAEYHNVVAWRKLAEICNQYLHKGSKVYVEGRLQTRSWDDQTGQKKYRTEIVADNMIILDSRASSQAASPTSSFPASAPAQPEPAPTEPVVNLDEPTGVIQNTEAGSATPSAEEIPF